MKYKRLEIRHLRKSDDIKPFYDFICELVNENNYLVLNKKPTMEEEMEWFKAKLAAIKNNQEIFICAWDGKKYVGNCNAVKGWWKESENVCLDIAVLKDYRGIGLGEKLLREAIKLTKVKFKPKNIYLTVSAPNIIAKNLYKKLGFRIIARLPKWREQNGEYIDKLYMLLKK